MDNKIHNILTSYINKLDSLIYSLPVVMESMNEDIVKGKLKFDKFIEDKVEKLEKKNDEDNQTYAIPIAYSKEFERQKQKLEHMSTAFDLLPKNFLVSFVSQYDSFLGDLNKELLVSKPELFNNSDRELKFKDLIEFNTIDDAREFLLEKEIETLLRKSHTEQFDWMINKFNLPLRKNLLIWKDFIEITERRNLFVHNNGTVSNQYIKVCNEHKVDISNIKVGDILTVSSVYLKNAYAVFYEIGFKLVQVLWRKLLPADLESADTSLINIAYELLIHKKYTLSITLLDFACDTLKNHNSDVNRRIMLVNRALSYKLAGNNEKCISILNKEDWSATGLNFQLAIAILQDKDKEVYQLMKNIGKDSQDFPSYVYGEWPLFEKYREKEDFKNIYKEIFNKELELIERL